MHPDALEEAGTWLEQSREDLSAAERIRDIGIHCAACFFAQQAGEKALKAAILALDLIPPRTHSLALLAAALEQARPDLTLAALVALLDQYSIPTRYPGALLGTIPARVYGPSDSVRAIEAARRAVQAGEQLVAGPAPGA